MRRLARDYQARALPPTATLSLLGAGVHRRRRQGLRNKKQKVLKARADGMSSGMGRGSGSNGLSQIGNWIGRKLHQLCMGRDIAADLGLGSSTASRAQASMTYANAGAVSRDNYPQQAQAAQSMDGCMGGMGGGVVGGGMGLGGDGGGTGGGGGGGMSLGFDGSPSSSGYGHAAGIVPLAATAGTKSTCAAPRSAIGVAARSRLGKSSTGGLGPAGSIRLYRADPVSSLAGP